MAPPEIAEPSPGFGSADEVGADCTAVVGGCTVGIGGAVLDGVTKTVLTTVEGVASLLVVTIKSLSPYPPLMVPLRIPKKHVAGQPVVKFS